MQKIFVYLHFFTTFALTYKLVGDMSQVIYRPC